MFLALLSGQMILVLNTLMTAWTVKRWAPHQPQVRKVQLQILQQIRIKSADPHAYRGGVRYFSAMWQGGGLRAHLRVKVTSTAACQETTRAAWPWPSSAYALRSCA